MSYLIGTVELPSWLRATQKDLGGILLEWYIQCGRCSRNDTLYIDDWPLATYGMKEAGKDGANLGYVPCPKYKFLCSVCAKEEADV